MEADERLGALRELDIEARISERLRALGEYAELRDRWFARRDRPGDRPRRIALRAVLERTGGVPPELHWPRNR